MLELHKRASVQRGMLRLSLLYCLDYGYGACVVVYVHGAFLCHKLTLPGQFLLRSCEGETKAGAPDVVWLAAGGHSRLDQLMLLLLSSVLLLIISLSPASLFSCYWLMLAVFFLNSH